MKTILIFGLFTLLLLSSVLASDIAAQKDESIIITTNCVIDGALYADWAMIQIFNVDKNETVLSSTNMTLISPGIFIYNVTFTENGNYVAVQSCFFPDNRTAQGSDDVTIRESNILLIIPLLGALCLLFGFKRKTLVFFAAICFILTIILIQIDLYIKIILFLVSMALIFRAARMDK